MAADSRHNFEFAAVFYPMNRKMVIKFLIFELVKHTLNTEMTSTLDSYHKNELYVSPVARNRWVPNHNYWTIFIITPIRIN